MALFGKRDREPGPENVRVSQARPLPGRKALCLVCQDRQTFTRCWMRADEMVQCPSCGMVFQNTRQLYAQLQPACPQCGEFLEQPGFEYGFCDRCGSKHEIVPGTKPGLLPNAQQRAEMARRGVSRSDK